MIDLAIIGVVVALGGRSLARTLGGAIQTVQDIVDASGAHESRVRAFDYDLVIRNSSDWSALKQGRAALMEFVDLPDWSDEDRGMLGYKMLHGLVDAHVHGTDIMAALRGGTVRLPESDIDAIRQRWRDRRDLVPPLRALAEMVARCATSHKF